MVSIIYTSIKYFVILASMLVLTASLSEAEETHCVCQVGTNSFFQKPFFTKGCQKWLTEQTNCSSKKIVDIPDFKNSFFEFELPESARGGLLKLGYVGHWSDTTDSELYILKVILPTIERNDVNVLIDNTACKGAEQPQLLVDFAKLTPILYPKNHWIKYRANQVTSIGVWDRFGMPASVNFWVTVTLPTGEITWPPCSEFKNKFCSGSLQKDQKAVCLTERVEPKELQCCPNGDQVTDLISSTPQNWSWVAADSINCQKKFW